MAKGIAAKDKSTDLRVASGRFDFAVTGLCSDALD